MDRVHAVFERSQMAEGAPSVEADLSTDTTRTIFKSFLKEVIKADGGSDIALSELLTRARIRFLLWTLDRWDGILWNMSHTLDRVDASLSDDILVQSRLLDWRRLWCNWRGLLMEFQATLEQTTSWIDKLGTGREIGPDGLLQLKIRLPALENDRKRLLGRIEASFQALMSTMSIIESRNAVSQGESISKLTELAFIFIPLSFATSFFGMEIKVSYQNQDVRYTSIH